jgi:glycosyltransferase involved in cell wall biosynthesis
MRCLWLARAMPFPLTSGDRIYTARLAEAVAAAGAHVTFVGLDGMAAPAPLPGITWHVVPGGPRGELRSLLSTLPMVAERHRTAAYRAELVRLAGGARWDVVVIDQYGMGWVLRHRRAFDGAPRFVFVAHDHEETVTRRQVQDRAAPPLRRLYFAQNHLKTRAIERATARACDMVTAITPSDAALFQAVAPDTPVLVLTPGYAGPPVAERAITAATPRTILLFGSLRWSAKQSNVRHFLERAHRPAARAGVAIHVVGDAPEELIGELRARYPGVTLTGFVADPDPYMDVRIGIVAEPIGGGFKMKLLDYVFRRIPVAALESCAEGLPPAVRQAMILRPDTDALITAVLEAIDDPVRLQGMQCAAFAAAAGACDWSERGRAFIEHLRRQSDQPPAAAGRPSTCMTSGRCRASTSSP